MSVSDRTCDHSLPQKILEISGSCLQRVLRFEQISGKTTASADGSSSRRQRTEWKQQQNLSDLVTFFSSDMMMRVGWKPIDVKMAAGYQPRARLVSRFPFLDRTPDHHVLRFRRRPGLCARCTSERWSIRVFQVIPSANERLY